VLDLVLALDSAGAVIVAKLQLNTDGFLVSAGDSLVIPYIDNSYDLWLFPTEAEADANDTSSAERVADDITGVNGLAISAVESMETLNDAVVSASILEGMAINIKERTAGNGGGAMWDVVLASSVTPNTFNIVSCTGNTDLALVLRMQNKTVYAEQLGAIADGVFDNQLVHLHIISLLLNNTLDKVVFGDGVHLYSVSHNWAVSRKIIDCTNNCRFRYTGADYALILAGDGHQGTAGCYNNFFGMNGRFIIEAPSTAKDGIFCNYYHHSKVRARVAGCGAGKAGALLKFCVVSEFDLHVTVNEEGWYLGAKPEIGINLDSHDGNGTPMSYCTFINPVVEATNIGIQLTQTLGNVFIGGTSEGCTLYGVFATTAARQDRFIGTDFEVNSVVDVYCQGQRVEFKSCDTEVGITFGSASSNCVVAGGQHAKLLNDLGATDNIYSNVVYNRFKDGTTFTDAGTNTKLNNVVNGDSGESYLNGSKVYNPPSIPSGGVITTTVSVTGIKKEDAVTVSFSESQSGIRISASPSAAGVVTVYLENVTGGAIDMAEGTLKIFGQRN